MGEKCPARGGLFVCAADVFTLVIYTGRSRPRCTDVRQMRDMMWPTIYRTVHAIDDMY